MNHATPVPANVVDTTEQLRDGQPGTVLFDVEQKALRFQCPCGCPREGVIPFQGSSHTTSWTWDGNRESPSLDPSIRRMDGCKWHGHLRAGVWEPCGDSGQ